MEKFVLLKDEATADVSFIALGRNLDEMFENAALAMSNIMIYKLYIKGKIDLRFKLKNKNLEYLLVDFLNKIIFYKDYKGVVITAAKVKITKNLELLCTAKAERLEMLRNKFLVDIKAATLHNLKIYKDDGLIKCKVVLDV